MLQGPGTAYIGGKETGGRAKSPIKISVLRDWLGHYPDKMAANYLRVGFEQGFEQDPSCGTQACNMGKELKIG